MFTKTIVIKAQGVREKKKKGRLELSSKLIASRAKVVQSRAHNETTHHHCENPSIELETNYCDQKAFASTTGFNKLDQNKLRIGLD